jgi:hypothetical protein
MRSFDELPNQPFNESTNELFRNLWYAVHICMKMVSHFFCPALLLLIPMLGFCLRQGFTYLQKIVSISIVYD